MYRSIETVSAILRRFKRNFHAVSVILREAKDL